MFSDVAEIVLNQCVSWEEVIDPKTGKPNTYEERNIEMDYTFLEDELAPWKKRTHISARMYTAFIFLFE